MTKPGKKIINIVTLGCSKNLVDSEVLMKQLDAGNFTVVHDSTRRDAKIVIVNTCGFINDAKEESINTILQFVQAKKMGNIENLFVMGCLSERYRDELKKEISEVDQYFGVNQLKDIIKTLGINFKKELLGERILTTPGHYAYLKISEGCDRTCAFCAIPRIRGSHVSKPVEQLIKEAEILARKGVKEFILVAQDLSYYGLDLYKKQKLGTLIERLSGIKGIEWIRLHYLYPANFPIEILKVIREKENICKYLDIALQHISDTMLTKMRRSISKKNTYQLQIN
ncbi:MAG: radical SAM protein [Bacteroidia bacterium]|nr:radical SAM protein [Bacteroidia bacterium]